MDSIGTARAWGRERSPDDRWLGDGHGSDSPAAAQTPTSSLSGRTDTIIATIAITAAVEEGSQMIELDERRETHTAGDDMTRHGCGQVACGPLGSPREHGRGQGRSKRDKKIKTVLEHF